MHSQSSSHEAALRAAHDTAVLFDLSDWSQLRMTGADRAAFLHNFCTADIKRLGKADGCEAFLTDIKGRILAHLLIAELESALWVVGSPGIASDVMTQLDRYVITEDVALENLSESSGLLLLAGPRAPAVAERELGCGADLPKYGARGGHCAGNDLRIMRVPLTILPGFVIGAQRTTLAAVRERLLKSDVTAGARSAFEALRIEAGFPLSNVDVTPDNLAQEAARTSAAISFTKGCYLGQEPIARLDALGHVNRELRTLKIAGPPPTAGTPVLDPAGDSVGTVTSSAPLEEGSVALAMLRSQYAKTGMSLFVAPSEGERHAATVSWHLLDSADA